MFISIKVDVMNIAEINKNSTFKNCKIPRQNTELRLNTIEFCSTRSTSNIDINYKLNVKIYQHILDFITETTKIKT